MGRPAAEIAAEDQALIPYGWAPGNYMGKCIRCNQTHTADKRAVQCRPCALDAFQAGINPGGAA